jgi:hypothetical protein
VIFIFNYSSAFYVVASLVNYLMFWVVVRCCSTQRTATQINKENRGPDLARCTPGSGPLKINAYFPGFEHTAKKPKVNDNQLVDGSESSGGS